MHAEAMPLRDPREEGLGGPLLMALALHLGVALLLLVGGWLQRPPEVVSVAGPVLDATLIISTADISAAEQTAEAAPKPAPRAELEMAPPPQPVPMITPKAQRAPAAAGNASADNSSRNATLPLMAGSLAASRHHYKSLIVNGGRSGEGPPQ